jgi:hypothetical protein
LLIVLAARTNVAAEETRRWKTGAGFQAELRAVVTTNWRRIALRSVLAQISAEHELAILLDRRVDPTRPTPVDFIGISLEEGLGDLARQLNGGCSLPGNVVYLGPSESARKLRTLIALRTAELADLENPRGNRARGQQQWLRKRTIHWDDLDSPREILQRLASDLDVNILNPDALEHDLWAEATLPQVSGIEAVSLLLIQFDLTFRWTEDADEIELVPIPMLVRIERIHKVRGKSPQNMLEQWQAAWPNADFRLSDGGILALATVEEHEAISAGKSAQAKPEKPPLPLSKREFTFKAEVPLKDLMAELAKTGIQFDYDAEALSAAGIDLGRFVKLDVRSLTADQLFHRLFDPFGLQFTIDGLTVTLSPKK